MEIIRKSYYDNVIDDCTLSLITVSQNDSNSASVNIRGLNPKPKESLMIIDYVPYYSAVKASLENTHTEFLIIMDDDMILNKDAVTVLYNTILQNDLDEVVFKLQDPIFGKIFGVRIYRVKKILQIVNSFKDGIWRDIDIHQELEKEKRTIRSSTIIGTHHEKWNPLDIYWKMFTTIKKLDRTPEIKKKYILRHFQFLCEHYVKEKNELIIYAMYGLINAIRDEKNEPILNYENKFLDPNIKDLIQKMRYINIKDAEYASNKET